jgi:hypothetical protein
MVQVILPLVVFVKHKLNLFDKFRLREISANMVDSVIVVSPLNSLMSNHISQLGMSGIRASFVNVKESTRTSQSEDDDAEVNDAEVETSN